MKSLLLFEPRYFVYDFLFFLFPLHTRLRLFDGTITPTVLYACTSWTLTNDLLTILQRTQRRMLRLILGAPRRTTQPPQQQDGTSQQETIEPWTTFIQRTTRIAEATMSRHNIAPWTTTYYKRKWRWAMRLATLPDDRWGKLITDWKPLTTEPRPAYRRQGRPHKRDGAMISTTFLPNYRMATTLHHEDSLPSHPQHFCNSRRTSSSTTLLRLSVDKAEVKGMNIPERCSVMQ